MLLQREQSIYSTDVCHDGTIAFRENSLDSGTDLYLLTTDGEVRPLATSASNESDARFAVDGRWIVYESNLLGRSEIHVMPLDGTSSPVQVTSRG